MGISTDLCRPHVQLQKKDAAIPSLGSEPTTCLQVYHAGICTPCVTDVSPIGDNRLGA